MCNRSIVSVWAVIFLSINVSAQSRWSEGHGDIGVSFHDGRLYAQWNLDAGGIVNNSFLSVSKVYLPGTLIAQVAAPAEAPAGAQIALGITEGSPVWRAGSHTDQPNLGISAHDIGDESDWAGGYLTVSLSDWNVNNPGEFGLYHPFAGWVFSTYAPSGSFDLYAGDHQHFSWYFTQPGYYELEFTWSGLHTSEGVMSLNESYGFYVVPEPSMWALLVAGLAAMVVVDKRKNRSLRSSEAV